jgi:hypothetical protein
MEVALTTTTDQHAPRTRGRVPYRITLAVRRVLTGEAFPDLRLTPRGRQALACVVNRATPSEGGAPVWESRARIAAKLGCSERTAIRRIGELVAADLVEYAGQGRSPGSGRFLNGHVRLTRAACEALGLTWSDEPGPATERAQSGIALIPPAPRRPRRATIVAPGQGVPPSLRSGSTGSPSRKHSPETATGSEKRGPGAFANAGGLRLPRELLWLTGEGQLRPTAVAALMGLATQHGQRLTDVAEAARASLAGKRGRHLFATLRRLIAKPIDYAFVARQRAQAAAARASAEREGRELSRLRSEVAGRWWQLPGGKRGHVDASGRFVEVWSASREGVAPVDNGFLRAVRDGRFRPAETNAPAAPAAPDFSALRAQLRRSYAGSTRTPSGTGNALSAPCRA